MGATRAKDLADQLAGAIGYQMLLGKAAGGVDQRHQFDDAGDAVEIAHRRMQSAQQINGNGARRLLALGRLHGGAKLADPGCAVFFGDMAADKDQITGLHKGHVGRCRHGHRGQGDAQFAEFVVNIHESLG